MSALLVVKDGYSPQEFYIAEGKQGPSSDLYALGATFYHLVTGNAPPNSQTRLAAIAAKEEDPYQAIATQVTGFDADFLAAIDKALNIFPKDRVQSAEEWAIEIDLDKRRASALAKARLDKNIERSISKLVSATNRAVLEDKRQRDKALKAAEYKPPIPAPRPPPKPVRQVPEQEIEAIQPAPTPEHKGKISKDEPCRELEQPSPEAVCADEAGPPRRRLFTNAAGRRSARRFWIFGKSRTEQLGKAGP